MPDQWWIATGRLTLGGEKVLGPFPSRELALSVRTLAEKIDAPVTYWVDSEPVVVADDAVRRAAEVMLRQYESEHPAGHLTWRDFADDAREILTAAAGGSSV